MTSEAQYDAQGLVRMDEEACWEFLEHHHLGRIAFVRHHRPLVYPVNYVIDDESVVFRTSPGSKLGAALRGSLVAFEVDEADELFESGTSVLVHGRVLEVTEPVERDRLADRLVRTWAPGERDHVIRVQTHWLTGRSIPLSGEDDGLFADGG
ncbi:MAG: pyridoxamine 5'-phosphate oxidase family protein [Acidimicrobiales bacterium]|nr:pyridoxamine 5'-phosphate oxidase family protein [Acidimicrobiales bacterium]